MEYISKEAALDLMKALEDEDIRLYGCQIIECFDGDRAIKALNTLPSINIKMVNGKYEEVEPITAIK